MKTTTQTKPSFPKIETDMVERLAAQAKAIETDRCTPPLRPTKRWTRLASW